MCSRTQSAVPHAPLPQWPHWLILPVTRYPLPVARYHHQYPIRPSQESISLPCPAHRCGRLAIEVKVTAKALPALIMLHHLYNFYLIYLKVAKMKNRLQK